VSGPDGYPVVTVSTISQSSSSTPRLTATARREQLLDVALGVFARSGYHDASMNDIAEAAGVTKPVLYQHFDSKRELYQALVDDVGSRLLTAIVSAAAEATEGREQTERGFQAYFRWVAEDHDAFMLLYGGSTRRDDEFAHALRQVTDGAAEAIAPLIAADIDDEHRLTLAHALVGLAEGASRRLVERGDRFDPDQIARQVSDLAWAGLRSVHRTA
jgi:AcrR family transcriptional regulator